LEKSRFTVIGGGPAGIGTVGKLIDNGIKPRDIMWVDPNFKVGDLGMKWSNVPGNTKLYRLATFLESSKAFGYDECDIRFPLRDLDQHKVYKLKYAVEPLQWVTEQLRGKVESREAFVKSLQFTGSQWNIRTDHGDISADNVVLTIGSEPKQLSYEKPVVDLEYALDENKIAKIVDPKDIVAVFGSSHSAIMSIRNLMEYAHVKQVINFYRNPKILYAVDYGDWVLRDNNGLKGDTAVWAREHLENGELEGILRVKATSENIEQHLPECTKVVYATGFQARSIPIEGFRMTGYDDRTGIIGPGLFGAGIAFPERVIDPERNYGEYNVGILKFMKYLERVVPLWIEKAQGAKQFYEQM
jgi:hypothetical protein